MLEPSVRNTEKQRLDVFIFIFIFARLHPNSMITIDSGIVFGNSIIELIVRHIITHII